MKNKPRCRYGCFKYCPEKPFYIRESFPWGSIKETDESGCNFWWIDLVERQSGTGKEVIQQGMCIDLWNAFYAKNSVERMVGNQQATEMLRNGLCYVDNNNKIQPKPTPLVIELIKKIIPTPTVLLNEGIINQE